eukprot:TRINITY_DN33665_c0_g1_i1.p1 TRINITY_DN33665_c0_g1~~TRINITY_DN33665_c0_g1_i1.p1  ORF type:complete len:447 (+),score=67.36 TRINITY_DN33665_c0_g1_i1:104-1342(+)
MFRNGGVAALIILRFLSCSGFVKRSVDKQENLILTKNQQAHDRFQAYMVKMGRDYVVGSSEYDRRFDFYQVAEAKVERLNARPGKTWKAGINSLSDMSPEEKKMLLGWRGAGRRGSAGLNTGAASRSFERVPPSPERKPEVDWGSLSSLFIRDQGACGSCWAAAATTVLDAHSEMFGKNQTFSLQQMTNCAPNPDKCGGTGACDGSTVELAMQYTMLVGVDSPEKYGIYTASTQDCQAKADEDVLKSLVHFPSAAMIHHAPASAPSLAFGMNGWQKLASNQFEPLLTAVNVGPVAVTIVATQIMDYSEGIFDDCVDEETGKLDFIVNHAVTLIGYGTEGTSRYWKVQNSWGENWGEEGRIRFRRRHHEDKHCGMDTRPQEGIACEGEDDPVQVCGTCGILYDSVMPLFGASL